MTTLLTCTECRYQKRSLSDREFMKKIIMMNHVRKAHPKEASQIMRTYSRGVTTTPTESPAR